MWAVTEEQTGDNCSVCKCVRLDPTADATGFHDDFVFSVWSPESLST